MSDSGFYKCACSYCQGHLEFPAHAVGITTTCPHCGVETTLVGPTPAAAPPPPPPAAPAASPPAATPAPPPVPVITPVAEAPAPASTGSKLKRGLTMVWSVLVGIAVLGFIGLKVWLRYRKVERAVETVNSESKPAPPKSPADSPKPVVMTPPVAPPSSEIIAKGTPPPRKPGEDLQVLSFDIHKAKDGNLQFIVGVVTNHAAKQFFNVKLEFELTRKDGKTGDTATDSIRNLAPNAGVPFKANIIGTAPVASAKLMKLEGEKE